jgi:hypothetical protein
VLPDGHRASNHDVKHFRVTLNPCELGKSICRKIESVTAYALFFRLSLTCTIFYIVGLCFRKARFTIRGRFECGS